MSFPNITYEKAMELLTNGHIYSLDELTYNACCVVKYIYMRKKDIDFDINNVNDEYKRFVEFNGSASHEMFLYYLNI